MDASPVIDEEEKGGEGAVKNIIPPEHGEGRQLMIEAEDEDPENDACGYPKLQVLRHPEKEECGIYKQEEGRGNEEAAVLAV